MNNIFKLQQNSDNRYYSFDYQFSLSFELQISIKKNNESIKKCVYLFVIVHICA